MAQKLKHINVLSFSTMMGGIYAILGLVAGLFTSLSLGLFGAAIEKFGGMSLFGMGIAYGTVAAVTVYPIILGISGFIGGAIFAFLYNILVPHLGGIEVELE